MKNFMSYFTLRMVAILASVVIFSDSYGESHKIIYLISPPRSLSVTFLRMMQSRGDFSIMHEPSQLTFVINNDPAVQGWFRSDAAHSFSEVKKSILKEAESHNVFVKEMSFAVDDFHLNDHELMENPDVYFVFLVRDPHHTTISMYKRLADIFDMVSKDKMPILVGYKALYNVYQEAKEYAANAPYIMRTKDLYNNPEETIQKFCDHVGIEFKPESLHWDALGEEFDGHEEWREIKYRDAVHHWHGDALKSTGFSKPTQYEVDGQGNPTFSEIENPEHRDICYKIYREHLPFYKLLMGDISANLLK